MGLVYVACVVHVACVNVLLSSANQVKATAQRENMQIQNPTGAMQHVDGICLESAALANCSFVFFVDDGFF